MADLTSNDDDLNQDSLQLFDAFHSPKLHFDERSKVYSLETGNYTLFPHLESRTAMYRDRLLLAQQRLLRNTSLRLQGLGGGTSRPSRDGTEALSISTVESLLGAQGENRILFGMITQVSKVMSLGMPLSLSSFVTFNLLLCLIYVDDFCAFDKA